MSWERVIHPNSPLLDHCPPSLPAANYVDPDFFKAEMQRIWRKNWIHVGRSNEIRPGTMRRITTCDQNIVLVKARDGQLTAFHNSCRHRGAELCAVDEKNLASKLITCPYHQWSYDLEGRLIHTPFVALTADFDKGEHGLFPVHVRQWNGFVFICLDDDPPAFEAASDPGVDALANWPMDRLVTGHTWTKTLACNWKIFWENYNECLHCPGIHPELCDLVPVYRRGYMAANEDPEWTPEAGSPDRVLKAGARSWSMNGLPCGPEFPNLSDAERAAGMTFVTLLPTMFVVAHVDYVRAVAVKPLGPELTELTAQWLFLPETLAEPGFDLANVTDFATLVLSQDAEACEMNQRGLRSGKFLQGTLMPQEFDVHRFQEWVRHRMA